MIFRCIRSLSRQKSNTSLYLYAINESNFKLVYSLKTSSKLSFYYFRISTYVFLYYASYLIIYSITNDKSTSTLEDSCNNNDIIKKPNAKNESEADNEIDLNSIFAFKDDDYSIKSFKLIYGIIGVSFLLLSISCFFYSRSYMWIAKYSPEDNIYIFTKPKFLLIFKNVISHANTSLSQINLNQMKYNRYRASIYELKESNYKTKKGKVIAEIENLNQSSSKLPKFFDSFYHMFVLLNIAIGYFAIKRTKNV